MVLKPNLSLLFPILTHSQLQRDPCLPSPQNCDKGHRHDICSMVSCSICIVYMVYAEHVLTDPSSKPWTNHNHIGDEIPWDTSQMLLLLVLVLYFFCTYSVFVFLFPASTLTLYCVELFLKILKSPSMQAFYHSLLSSVLSKTPDTFLLWNGILYNNNMSISYLNKNTAGCNLHF